MTKITNGNWKSKSRFGKSNEIYNTNRADDIIKRFDAEKRRRAIDKLKELFKNRFEKSRNENAVITFIKIETRYKRMSNEKFLELVYDKNLFGKIERIDAIAFHKNNFADPFYSCEAWLKTRNYVIAKYGKICMKCGTSKKQIHVDHILPRSKYPSLELEFDNLQVLCKDCNIEKSNKDYTDYRNK